MIIIQSLVCGHYDENAYIVYEENRDDLVVIDPGDDLNALEQAIRTSGKKLTDILLTHGHFDHTLAAAPLREKYGAPVRIHPLDEHMLFTHDAALMDESVSSLPFVPIRADAPYPTEDRFELSAGGMTFECLHTPGHTPGGVCLILEEAQAVFTGDTIFSHGFGRYDFPGGDRHQLMKSLQTILALPKTLTVYSGHGEAGAMGDIAAHWNIR